MLKDTEYTSRREQLIRNAKEEVDNRLSVVNRSMLSDLLSWVTALLLLVLFHIPKFTDPSDVTDIANAPFLIALGTFIVGTLYYWSICIPRLIGLNYWYRTHDVNEDPYYMRLEQGIIDAMNSFKNALYNLVFSIIFSIINIAIMMTK